MDNWYEEQAHELIRRAEGRKQDSLEQFYRGLKDARDVINERLETAREELPDGAVDLLGIDGEFE